MNRFLELFLWAGRAWPLWAWMLLGEGHWFALSLATSPDEVVKVNKFVSALFGVIGVGFLFYSIDSNLGLFRKQNMLKIFMEFGSEFPLLQRTRTYTVHCDLGIAYGISGGRARISGQASTLEGRMAEAERQIKENYDMLERAEREFSSKITELNDSFASKLAESNRQLEDLNSKLQESAVGGFLVQLFGGVLVLHGAVTSYFA